MPKNPGFGIRHSSLAIKERAALGILACALTALVYQPALDLPFVFDDRTTVLLNPSLVDLWDLRAILFQDLPRAVVNFSYAVDRAFWGFSSFGFHITNFVLHIIVVGLFYGWCTRALADNAVRLRPFGATARQHPGSDPGLTPGVEWAAFFAAAAFGLHPLMGATAAYVSARSEILGAAAFLAALTFARRAVLTSDIGPAALAVGFGAVAAASSPAGAALPVVMLAYDRWVMRTKGWERRLWRLYLPLVTVAALTAAWRLQAALTVVHVPSRDFLENLMTESIVVWRYAGLLVFPAGQAIVHDVHWVTSPADPLALLALAAIAAAVASAVSFRRQAPLAAVCAIWFFAALAPTSSWIPLRDAMSEPRTYVAATGLFLAAAWLAAGPLATRRSARLVAVGVLVILAVVAHVRTRVWADPLRLWEESVRRAPEAWQAHLGYAESLREIQQCTRALPEYEATLSLYADEPQAIAGLKACRR